MTELDDFLILPFDDKGMRAIGKFCRPSSVAD